MSIADEIRRPIVRRIEEYEAFLARHMRSTDERVGAILSYILGSGGKGIRPMTVILSAALNNPAAQDRCCLRTYLGAMLVEMMHTASLVHDDVIDESDTRRGKPSARAVLNSRGAVIVGDLILARSISIGLESAQYDIVDYVVRAMTDLCEGELIQSEQSRTLTMTREIYLDIIGKKTAVLFGVSAGVGALSVGASSDGVSAMRLFGELVGTAFQIRDDILDYGSANDTGKPALNDLRERKVTLPLLAVLERSDPSRRNDLLARLASAGTDLREAEYLRDVVMGEGGIEESAEVARSYVGRAREILLRYPPSPERDSLSLLAEWAGERDK